MTAERKSMGKQTCFEKLVAEAKKNITEIFAERSGFESERRPRSNYRCTREDEWYEGHIPGGSILAAARSSWRSKKKFRHEHDHYLPLRWRRSLGARGREFAKMGYKNVRSMAGGFKAWKTAGLPTTK